FKLVRSMWQYRDLQEALGFYGAYHQDPVNQAIHFVFVPALLWSFLVGFAHFPLLGKELSVAGHRLTYSTLIFFAY
ncbi:unnamed protein product, partial [Polarella glacialis]